MFKKCIYENSFADANCESLIQGQSSFFSPAYGFCYSFNFHGPHESARDEWLSTPFSGPFYGLTLVIDTQGTYYLRNGLTEDEGVRVAIHHPADVPVLSSSGYDIRYV